MDDLISREAAIEAIDKRVDEVYENIKMHATFPQRSWFDGMAHAQSILVNLPSAQPERKKGRWIKQNPMVDTEECSECGYNILGEEFETPFCPWCGSRMVEGEEG